MVIERYYETQINSFAKHPNTINSHLYKLLNGPDYSLIRYTVEHTIDFVKGFQQITSLLGEQALSKQLLLLADVRWICQAPVIAEAAVLNGGNCARIAWVIGPVVHGLSAGKRHILREVEVVRGGVEVASEIAGSHDIHRLTGVDFDVRLSAVEVVGKQIPAAAGEIALDRHAGRAEGAGVLQLQHRKIVEPGDQAF